MEPAEVSVEPENRAKSQWEDLYIRSDTLSYIYIYQASLYMSAQFEGKHSNKMIRQGPTEAQFTEKMFSLYIT